MYGGLRGRVLRDAPPKHPKSSAPCPQFQRELPEASVHTRARLDVYHKRHSAGGVGTQDPRLDPVTATNHMTRGQPFLKSLPSGGGDTGHCIPGHLIPNQTQLG